jgi:hypothetical protein
MFYLKEFCPMKNVSYLLFDEKLLLPKFLRLLSNTQTKIVVDKISGLEISVSVCGLEIGNRNFRELVHLHAERRRRWVLVRLWKFE